MTVTTHALRTRRLARTLSLALGLAPYGCSLGPGAEPASSQSLTGGATAPVQATYVHKDQTSGGPTLVSGSLTTSAPELLIALLASDAAAAGSQFASVTGCGLTWSRVVAVSGQPGPAEIWTANATAPLASCTVTATRGFGSWQGAITIVGFTGAGGVGAHGSRSAASGAPSVSLTTTGSQSLVYAVGNDWSTAVARTPASGQQVLSTTLTSVGDTYWVQKITAAVASPGSVTVSDTAPTGDMFNYAAVEILGTASSSGDAGAPDAAPDATVDAAPDAAPDAATDSGTSTDAATDAGSADGGAGPSPSYYGRWTPGLPTRDTYFPIGVWQQDARWSAPGYSSNAAALAACGINLVADTPNPLDTEQMDDWHAAGIAVIPNAGDAPEGVDLTNVQFIAQHPAYANDVVGWFVSDEADMNDNPSRSAWYPSQVQSWSSQIHAADPTRMLYQNLGKGIGAYPWVGYHNSPAGDDPDLFAYEAATDIASVDYYGITDPYEGLTANPIPSYGDATEHQRHFVNDARPVWGFVETGQPWTNTAAAPTPAQLESAVWMMLIHGARGILYFIHDFYDDANGTSYNSLVQTAYASIRAKVTAVDARVTALAPVLNSANVDAASVVTVSNFTASVGVDVMVKRYGGSTYVFAIGRNRGATQATFTVAGGGNGTVTVRDEGRTLTMTNGAFTDSFAADNAVHIYQF